MLGSAAVALALRVGGIWLWLLFSVIVARTLPITDVGIVFFAINLIQTAAVVATMGYDVAVLRAGTRFWRHGERTAFRALLTESQMVVAASGLISILILAGAVFANVETPVTQSYVLALLVGLSIAASALMAVQRDSLRGADKLQEGLFGFSVLRAAIPLVLSGLVLMFASMTVERALVLQLLGLVASLLWGTWHLRRLRLPKAPTIRMRHLSEAVSIWPGEAALIAFQRAGGVAIGLTAGLEAAAIFLAAQRIAVLGTFLTDAVRTAIGPMLAQAERHEQQLAVSRSSILMAVTSLAGTALLLLFGGGALWLFGPAYFEKGFVVLLALLAGQLSWAVLGPSALVLVMLGAPRSRSTVTVAVLVAQLAVLPFVTSAIGVAVVCAVASWVMNLAQNFVIRRTLGLRCGLRSVSRSDLRWFWNEEVGGLRRRFKRPVRS